MYSKKTKQILCGDYVRLSREDGDKLESDSIRNQRELIAEYHRKHPELEFVDEYVDDGYSGTNFDRPGFTRMFEDAASGKINCIIVKDLSRMGRNYIETGRYLEKIFPSMGVRVLAINDNYDSEDEKNDSDHIIIPFKNLINDAYCRDMSTKIRSQLDIKRKKGQFIGSFAGYGYVKDPKDKNHLLVDETAAEVVRLIFQWKLDGMSSQNIAEKLDEMGALPPMEYKRRCGLNYNSGFRAGAEEKWSVVSVNRILRNEMYTGVMVQGIHRKINYKIKQSIDVEKENWIRVSGTHDAIIPEAVFGQVQKLLELDTRTAAGEDTVYLFSGFLRCGSCGQSMVKRSCHKKDKTYYYYHCSTYKDGKGCTSHNISETKLMKAVADAIHAQAELLMDADALMEEARRMPGCTYGVKKIDAQIRELEKEEERYEELKSHLYEDMYEGLIDKDEFQMMKANFSKRIRKTRDKIWTLSKKRDEAIEKSSRPYPWLEDFCRFKGVEHLDRKVLSALVEYITIYSKDRIEIRFRHEDEMMQLLEAAKEYQTSRDKKTAVIDITDGMKEATA